MNMEDVCVWPCGHACHAWDLEDMLAPPCAMSDDYKVYPYDSWDAAYYMGDLEVACQELFSHNNWQVLNVENMIKLAKYLGIEPPQEEEPCGYCGSSGDPNDICKTCWDAMQAKPKTDIGFWHWVYHHTFG